MLGNEWFSIAGLMLDATGVGLIASAARISKEAAVALGTRLVGDTVAENLRLPMVQHLLQQSKKTVNGLVLVGAGFVLQIIGSWP